MEHKHKFGPWKKLIFTKVRYCKVCELCDRKELVFSGEKKVAKAEEGEVGTR